MVKGYLEFLEEASQDKFMGVVKHKMSGKERKVYAHPTKEHAVVLFDGKHQKVAATYASKKDMEKDHEWTRFPSKNESEDLDESYDDPDDGVIEIAHRDHNNNLHRLTSHPNGTVKLKTDNGVNLSLSNAMHSAPGHTKSGTAEKASALSRAIKAAHKNGKHAVLAAAKKTTGIDWKHHEITFDESEENLDEAFTTHKADSYTDSTEGTVIPIHKAKLSKLSGFDTKEDEDGYSPTHIIKCSETGQMHTAYTRNGELRVRPYGKVSSSVTDALVKHLTPGIDVEKKVRESMELDEVSKALLGRYINKATDHAIDKGHEVGLKKAEQDEITRFTNRHGALGNLKGREELHKKAGVDTDSIDSTRDTMLKRRKGINKAVAKLTKEDLDELDLSEVSKELLGRYIKKAGPDNASREVRIDRALDPSGKNIKDLEPAINKVNLRQNNINKAVDKLTKESLKYSIKSLNGDVDYYKIKNPKKVDEPAEHSSVKPKDKKPTDKQQ